jgi:hypothetical protein
MLATLAGEENRAVYYSAPTKSARATSGRKRPHARSCHPPPRTRTHAMSVANFGSECVPVGGARSEPFGASANAPRSARVNRQRPAPPRSRRPFPPLTPLSPPVPSSQRDQAHGQGAVLRPLERGEGQHLRRRRRRFRPRRSGRRSQARPRCVRAKPKRKEKPSPGRGPPIPPALGRRSGRPPRVLAHKLSPVRSPPSRRPGPVPDHVLRGPRRERVPPREAAPASRV